MKLSFASLLPGSDRGWKSTYSLCSYEDCQNTRLMRSVQSRGGIGMGGQWYCGTDCFAIAARKRFAALVADGSTGLRHNPRLSIGLVMLSKGTLTTASFGSPWPRAALAAKSWRPRFFASDLPASARSPRPRRQWGYPILARTTSAGPSPRTFRRTCCASVPLCRCTSPRARAASSSASSTAWSTAC